MTWLTIAALSVAVLSLLVSALLMLRIRRVGAAAAARRRVPGPGVDDSERVEAVAAQVVALARRIEGLEAQAPSAIQRVGIVRYNPFADTGSNQSFVVALLDARGNGFVLTSQHSRQQTRVFLKSVTAGRAESALSEEETEAIRRAGGS